MEKEGDAEDLSTYPQPRWRLPVPVPARPVVPALVRLVRSSMEVLHWASEEAWGSPEAPEVGLQAWVVHRWMEGGERLDRGKLIDGGGAEGRAVEAVRPSKERTGLVIPI